MVLASRCAFDRGPKSWNSSSRFQVWSSYLLWGYHKTRKKMVIIAPTNSRLCWFGPMVHHLKSLLEYLSSDYLILKNVCETIDRSILGLYQMSYEATYIAKLLEPMMSCKNIFRSTGLFAKPFTSQGRCQLQKKNQPQAGSEMRWMFRAWKLNQSWMENWIMNAIEIPRNGQIGFLDPW